MSDVVLRCVIINQWQGLEDELIHWVVFPPEGESVAGGISSWPWIMSAIDRAIDRAALNERYGEGNWSIRLPVRTGQ